MSVWYLELDDEITDAVARLRAAKDDRVVLVVPLGSRIGTGRINFRLLAREAETRGLALILVSGDAQVRALAASAGLDAFSTVSEAESAEAAGGVAAGSDTGTPDGAAAPATAGAAAAGAGATAGATAAAVAATRSTAPGATATMYPDGRPRTNGGSTAKPTIARRPRGRRVAILGLGAAVVLLAASGGLYGAYVTIPQATITLAQTDRDIDPVTLTLLVQADQPTDAALGRIQGQRFPIAGQREAIVAATGESDPVMERAAGQVTFSNHSPNDIRVPDQTQVRTDAFVVFETQGGIVVPAGGSLDAEIRALVSGQGGNVDAGAITVMPPELKDSMIGGTVTNKEPTTGGDTVPTYRVTQDDWDTAIAAVTLELQADLAVQAADPDGLPEGDLVYPSTASAGIVATDLSADVVIGQPVATKVVASLAGSVLTASGSAIDDVGNQRLQMAVPAGTKLVDGSVRIALGEPAIGPDGVVTYESTATGRAYVQTLNEADIKNAVRGKTIAEARDRLKDFGAVDITLSPDFMPTLPDDPNRITLIITPRRTPPP